MACPVWDTTDQLVSAFCVLRSALEVRRSTFDVRRSRFCGRRSACGERRTQNGERRTENGERRTIPPAPSPKPPAPSLVHFADDRPAPSRPPPVDLRRAGERSHVSDVDRGADRAGGRAWPDTAGRGGRGAPRGGDADRSFLRRHGGGGPGHQPSGADPVVAVLRPGQFTGETNLLSGRRGFMTMRVSRSGTVIELDREPLVALVQTDSDLGEVLLKAFILRRVEIIARGISDVVLVGSKHSPGTLRIKEFLTRNGHPYAYIDLEHDHGVQDLLDRFHVGLADVPFLICRGVSVLRNPTNSRLPSASASTRRSTRPPSAIWSSSAPDRRDWRPRSTAPRKGSTCWYSRRARPVARPGRAR